MARALRVGSVCAGLGTEGFALGMHYTWNTRGYASNHRFVPNGWDCPVVLAAHRPELTNHGNEFHNGSGKKYCRVENFKIPIAELGLAHVTVHKYVFFNYQQLPQRWERLEGPKARTLRRCFKGIRKHC